MIVCVVENCSLGMTMMSNGSNKKNCVKYRCPFPQCSARYCSVGCYKIHKDISHPSVVCLSTQESRNTLNASSISNVEYMTEVDEKMKEVNPLESDRKLEVDFSTIKESSIDISLPRQTIEPKADQIIENDAKQLGLLNENQKNKLIGEQTLRKLLRSKRLRDHIADIDKGGSDAERSTFLDNMRKNNSEFREFTHLLLKIIEEQTNKQ